MQKVNLNFFQNIHFFKSYFKSKVKSKKSKKKFSEHGHKSKIRAREGKRKEADAEACHSIISDACAFEVIRRASYFVTFAYTLRPE